MSRELSRLVHIGLEGSELDPAGRTLIERLRPGGVVLFGRNVGSLEQLARLCADLKQVDPELVLSIDQEGGPVDRLRPHVPSLPSARALGVSGDPDFARRAGELTGECLAGLGLDLDFAPVCDLAVGGSDNAIGLRAFDPEAERAARFAGAFLAGLESRGIGGCLKHFPGLGLALSDSHLTLPIIPATEADLAAADLRVFHQLHPVAGLVMVSHGYYPHLTTRGILPATLSEEVSSGLLRGEMGYEGAAVSDDLVMGALATEEIGDAAVRALAAGCDWLLVCQGEERIARVIEAVGAAGRGGAIGANRAAEALERDAALRARLLALRGVAGLPPAASFDRAALEPCLKAMASLCREVATRSVSWDRKVGPRERLGGPVVVLRPRVKWLSEECARPEGSPFLAALAEARIEGREVAYDSETADRDVPPLLDRVGPETSFLLATYDAQRKPAVGRAARMLGGRAPLFHLALSWPGDLTEAPVRASVASLGCGWHAVAEATRVLCGLVKPRLPVLTG